MQREPRDAMAKKKGTGIVKADVTEGDWVQRDKKRWGEGGWTPKRKKTGEMPVMRLGNVENEAIGKTQEWERRHKKERRQSMEEGGEEKR